MQTRAMNLALGTLAGTVLVGGVAAGVTTLGTDTPATRPAAHAAADENKTGEATGTARKKAAKPAAKKALLTGKTTASYFWDDGSGVNGDTGAPAGGKPMQKGLFASPSWPMHTKVKVTYNGRSVTGFVGDRGPGEPSHRGVMLDLDTYTFRYLLDGKKPESKYNAGSGEGHLNGVRYEVLKWGSGAGKGKPRPFGA
jgi:hypothetical protein